MSVEFALCLLLSLTPASSADTPYQFPYEAMVASCPGAVETTTCLDQDGYDEIACSIRAVLDSLSRECRADYCPQADVLGCWVRIAGHDFMDYDPTSSNPGGADGCIDFHDHENAGLWECLYEGDHGVSLNSVYQNFCTRVSLADFIVLSAEAAMDWSRTAHNLTGFEYPKGSTTRSFKSEFEYGRTTASSCNSYTDVGTSRLPDPLHGCNETERVFITSLGLNWEESTALMGVHSMGRAEVKNSGHHGWWVSPEESRIFDNGFYRALLGVGWIPVLDVIGSLSNTSLGDDIPSHLQGVATKHQWERGDIGHADLEDPAHEMMLNTDMCLAYTRGEDDHLGHSVEDEGEYLAQDMNVRCCSWTFTTPLSSFLSEFEYCGAEKGSVNEDSMESPEEFELCCGAGERKPFGAKTPYNCGPVGGPGAGGTATLRFAEDEEVWMKQFGRAWKQATTVGWSGLKSLEDTCSDSQGPITCATATSTTATTTTPTPTATTTTATTTTPPTATTTIATTTPAPIGDGSGGDGATTVTTPTTTTPAPTTTTAIPPEPNSNETRATTATIALFLPLLVLLGC